MAKTVVEVKLPDAGWQEAEVLGADPNTPRRLIIRTRNGFVTSVHEAATRPVSS